MFVKAIIAVVLAAILLPVMRFVWDLGWYRHFHKHHPGKCWAIKRPGAGSEDIEILSSGQVFFTSAIFPDSPLQHKFKYNGLLLQLDMNLPTPEGKAAILKHDKNFDPKTFQPHGLSILEDKVKGEHLLYVINHVTNEADRIEKFHYYPKTNELHHVKSIFIDLLRFTNDLIITAEDQFYISNFRYFHPLDPRAVIFENIFYIPLGSVLFFNGTNATVVVNRLLTPNGVIVSKDKQYLYVAISDFGYVAVYKIESDHSVHLVQEAYVHTMVDNFHMSEDGNSILVGCHPIPYKLVTHLFNPLKKRAPSQILRLPLKDGLIVEEEITEEFFDNGNLISGASVAGVFKNRMLIGSVQDKTVICELQKN